MVGSTGHDRPRVRGRVAATRRAQRRAFTLVEVILVIAVLAILATMVVPRLSSTKRSEDRLASQAVTDLVRMFAYRNAIMTQQVGIWREPETGLIKGMIRDIDPFHPNDDPIWQEDRLSMPVSLPDDVEIVDVRIDDLPQRTDEWFVQTSADGSRPRFEVSLRSPEGETRILLEPTASGPVVYEAGKPAPFVREAVDLDREGLERSRW